MTRQGLAFALLVCMTAGTRGQSTLWSVTEFPPLAGLGTAMNNAGDVDGDGVADAIVGTGYYPSYSGGYYPGNSWGMAVVLSGATGAILNLFLGSTAFENLGYSVAGAGDVDGDGILDVVAGAPTADNVGLVDVGRLVVLSGFDGTELLSFLGTTPGSLLGHSVSAGADMNLDGIADFAVSAPGAAGGGRVLVVSATGSVIGTWTSVGSPERFGNSVCLAGDLDADGLPDLAATSTLPTLGLGRVSARSATGAVLWTTVVSAVGTDFGRQIAPAGDVNGDGVPDLVTGAWEASPGGVATAGRVFVFSGTDGAVILTFNGRVAGEAAGFSVAGAGDVDGDGRADLLVGAPASQVYGLAIYGRAYVVSGLNANILATILASVPGDRTGASVAALGDLNFDAQVDVVVGAPRANFGGARPDCGEVRARTFGFARMTVNAPPLIGSVRTFTLSSPATPGAPFVAAFSTGFFPGIPAAPGLTIPLNADALFAFTLGGGAPVFSGLTGTLSAAGTATFPASIPLQPSLVGTTIYGAFAVAIPAAPGIAVSSALPLTIL